MMDKLLQNKTSMRIFSLILSIILWIYIVIVLNPVAEITVRGVPVAYSQESVITDNNLSIVNDRVSTVDLKIRGRRNMLTDINNKNILASIDLSKCGTSGSYTLPIHISLPFDEISIIDKKPYNISVLVDKVVTKTFDIVTLTNGTVKDGYVALPAILNPDSISVTGTTDKINAIDRAAVIVNVNQVGTNVTTTAKVKLLGPDGTDVNSEGLVLSTDKVEVKTTVLQKKVVPVKANIVGEASEVNIIENKEVTILGSSDLLDKITEVNTIPIDVTALTENTVLKVDIDLPDNISMEEKVQVSVEIRK